MARRTIRMPSSTTTGRSNPSTAQASQKSSARAESRDKDNTVKSFDQLKALL